jgi:hypothetical protein
LGNWLVTQIAVGQNSDTKRSAVEQPNIIMKAVAKIRQAGQRGFTEAECFQISQLIGLGAD